MDRKVDDTLKKTAIQKPVVYPAIYPVISAVPESDRRLTGREKVAALSRHARRALTRSSRKIGHPITRFPKNDAGAPIPVNGIFWSISHKTAYVAAVAAPEPIGIDIEQQKTRSSALFKRIAEDREWALGPMDTPSLKADLFSRYWTAKEAVLKAAGVGIRGLSKCRILKIVDHDRLIVEYNGTRWHVAHMRWDDHMVSVTKGETPLNWILPRDNP